MSTIGRRLTRLEVQERGEGRIIVVAWPKGDAAEALRTKGVEERADDLIININKAAPADFSGWVSVDGVRLV